MVRAALACVFAAGLGSCASYPASHSRASARDDHTITATPAAGAVAGRVTYSMPIPVPGQPTCIIPFGIETTKGWFQDSDPFSRGGMPSTAAYRDSASSPWQLGGWGGPVRWHNAIVRDMESGKEWAILDRRGIVSQWWVLGPQPKDGEQFRTETMVFIATTEDSNGDGLLNDLDASVAIATDGEGGTPRGVSPAGAQVWSTAYDEEKGLIYLFVVTDTSGDGRFGTEDAGVPFVVKARGADRASPVLSGEIRSRVEAVFKQ